MLDATKTSAATDDLMKNSSLYQHFQAQREEVMKHQWIESEKAGQDIGFERALTAWLIRHRAQWLKRRQPESQA
jgi:hypothetical protein